MKEIKEKLPWYKYRFNGYSLIAILMLYNFTKSSVEDILTADDEFLTMDIVMACFFLLLTLLAIRHFVKNIVTHKSRLPETLEELNDVTSEKQQSVEQ